jgi:hypothetical protein
MMPWRAVIEIQERLAHAPKRYQSCHTLIFSEQLRARACSLFRRSRWRLLGRRRRKPKTGSGVVGMPRSPSRLRSDAPRIFDPFRRNLFPMGQTGQRVSFFRFGRETGTGRYGK